MIEGVGEGYIWKNFERGRPADYSNENLYNLRAKSVGNAFLIK